MLDREASDPRMEEPARGGPIAQLEPVTCFLCGCLCDDLVVRMNGDRVVEVDHECEVSREWLLRDRTRPEGGAVAKIQGVAATAEAGIARAAELLAAARAPVVLGMTYSTNETMRAALELADLIGASVEPGDPTTSLPRLFAFQRAGRVSATLGEVKNRADVVVFWGADPVESHPRHWQRYSVEPQGRFVPEGRAGRTVIVIDRGRTATAEKADLYLAIDPEREFEILWTLRAMVRGVEQDASRVRRVTGCALDELRQLASHLIRARYGAWFQDTISSGQPLSLAAQTIEAATLLVRDLNQKTRFVMLGMGGPGNPAGVEAVMAWQTGFPASVDLGAGHPRSLPMVTSAADRLARGEADLALIIGELYPDQYREEALRRLEKIPVIVIAQGEVAGLDDPDVKLRSAVPGWDDPGTVMRTDGVMLPLKALVPARDRTEREWLEALRERIPPDRRQTYN
jgi:formylmethanofuran dehydrogenase subunit B